MLPTREYSLGRGDIEKLVGRTVGNMSDLSPIVLSADVLILSLINLWLPTVCPKHCCGYDIAWRFGMRSSEKWTVELLVNIQHVFMCFNISRESKKEGKCKKGKLVSR